MKKENPDADFKDISNVLGTKWKALSVEEKKPYIGRYQQEKEAYQEVVKQEKREKEAMKLLEEEQMQKSAMELLEQYMQFQQVNQFNITFNLLSTKKIVFLLWFDYLNRKLKKRARK